MIMTNLTGKTGLEFMRCTSLAATPKKQETKPENVGLTKLPLNKIKAAKETFFKRKPDAKAVYVINHYNKCDKTYSCSDYETGREIFLKSTTPVFVGFEY